MAIEPGTRHALPPQPSGETGPRSVLPLSDSESDFGTAGRYPTNQPAQKFGSTAGSSGNALIPDHRIRDLMAVGAEECHIERLLVLPVVALEPLTATAPGATARPNDQPELLSQRSGIPRRAGSNPPWPCQIETNFQMATKTCELGVLAIASALFHIRLPAFGNPKGHPETATRLRFPLHRRSP